MFAVDFRHLTKRYGRSDIALSDISFGIEAGSFFGILGAGGSGKTSMLRLIFDYIRPTSGEISVFDRDSVKRSTSIRGSAAFVPARVTGQSRMRIRDILAMLHASYGPMNEERAVELCSRFHLDFRDRFDVLDAGERKRLAIVSAILNDPPLIVLDEPSLNLDYRMQTLAFAELQKLHDNGSTIVFSTISVEEIVNNCTHAALLSGGTLQEIGVVEEMAALRAQQVVLESPEAVEIVNTLGINSFKGNDTKVSFLYTEETDKLVKTMAQFPVTALRIEAPTLEGVMAASRILIKEAALHENECRDPEV